MTKSLDPGMEILTAPSKTQEGHAVRFRLKLKQLSSSSFSNSSFDGNSPKTTIWLCDFGTEFTQIR